MHWPPGEGWRNAATWPRPFQRTGRSALFLRATPSRGSAPAVLALPSGDVQAGILGTHCLLPETRTLAELGYPAFNLQTTLVAMVPAKTPDTIAQALHEAQAQAMRAPELQEQVRNIDIAPSALKAQEAADTLTQAREDCRRMVQAAGMWPE